MSAPELLATERLRLRRAVAADAEANFAEYAQDREVTKSLAWRPAGRLDDTRSHLPTANQLWSEGTSYLWAILKKENDQLLGTIAARVEGHKVE